MLSDSLVMDVLRKWETHGMKMAKIGVAVNFTFTLRKRIILSETLDRLTNFEVDQEFQQVRTTKMRYGHHNTCIVLTTYAGHPRHFGRICQNW